METIRLVLLRACAILGYVPNAMFFWLIIGPGWREEHRIVFAQMWRGNRP